MPKIITFTANLLAETTYEFADWSEGKTVRATAESFQVGGKGINVSKMLDRLNASNAALCFPGGHFGPMCETWLAEAGIASMAFTQGCETRSGTVIRSKEKEETTFLGLDSHVSKESVLAAIAALGEIEEPFIFAVCGSVQNWEGDQWKPLLNWIEDRGAPIRLVVDNYGPSLLWFASQKPDLIKFNRQELELLFDEKERTGSTEDLLIAANERFVCSNWVVTDGGGPIHVLSEGGAVESFDPPRVECVSPTGCGDVFYATLLDCLYNKTGYSLLTAAKLAADYASRSAAMPGIAEFEF